MFKDLKDISMIKYTIHKAKHFVQINVRGTYTACIHKTTTKYSS